MPSPSRGVAVARRTLGWSLGWVLAGAFYLLLIDITQLPELLVGAGAVTLAATGLELAREQAIGGEGIRLRWLLRVPKVLLKIPGDVGRVSVLAFAQLIRPEPLRGGFRTLTFASEADERRRSGSAALAETFGSIAPNTLIVGVDAQREVIVAHQLQPVPGRQAIDPLELGER